MKTFLKELISENSPTSSTRVMSFISLFSGVGIAAYGLTVNRDLMGLSALCAVFVGSAFGAKTISKFIENKNSSGE